MAWRRYVHPFCVQKTRGSVNIQSNVKQTVLPLLCSITQCPSQLDTTHTVRPGQTPFDHTDPDRCLYICCRQIINNSQLVLEVAHCCTVLILLYCGFIILYFILYKLYMCEFMQEYKHGHVNVCIYVYLYVWLITYIRIYVRMHDYI
jgi:hypothetical protein